MIDLKKLQTIHGSLKKYEDYLKEVRDKHPENFIDIAEIIQTYTKLVDIYNNLRKEEENINQKKKQSFNTQKIQNKMIMKYIKEKKNSYIHLMMSLIICFVVITYKVDLFAICYMLNVNRNNKKKSHIKIAHRNLG